MGTLIVGENDLLTKQPDLALEWHPTKNGDLNPWDVGEKSNKHVWWLYPYDDPITSKHFNFEWEATPNSRANGCGCPFISNKALWPGFNDLATRNPELASEWHPYKNGDLTPDMVFSNGSQRVWWYLPYDVPDDYQIESVRGKHFDFEWEASINNRAKGSRCPFISGRCAWKGYNDMWTTNPEIASLLVNKEDGYKFMMNTDKRLEFKCPECGNTVFKKPRQILNDHNQFLCPKCGDDYSFPEKFVFNVLDQLGIDFVYQLSRTYFDWCQKYRYDFYIKESNMIIEVNGRQHYQETSRTKLKEVINNDEIKRQLALDNGIEYYIYIDATISNKDYLCNSIKKSLSCYFDLSSVDWGKCAENASKSLLAIICKEWDNKKSLIYELSDKYHISYDYVKYYLKKGSEIGLCEFDSKQYQERVKSDGTSRKQKHKIICIETGEIFNSAFVASQYYNVDIKKIHSVCRTKKHKFNNNHLMYYDDYFLINNR